MFCLCGEGGEKHFLSPVSERSVPMKYLKAASLALSILLLSGCVTTQRVKDALCDLKNGDDTAINAEMQREEMPEQADMLGYYTTFIKSKDGREIVDHAYVYAQRDNTCVQVYFPCYLPLPMPNKVQVARDRGDLSLARVISCGDPDDTRWFYYRQFAAADSSIGIINRHGETFGLGDCSGIIYGLTGVCFQMANRILYSAEGYPRLCPEKAMRILYLVYGIYGNTYKFFYKKGVGSLNWLEFLAASELIYEKAIPVPDGFDYTQHMPAILQRALEIQSKLTAFAKISNDRYLLNEMAYIDNPVLLILSRFRLLCEDAGISPEQYASLKKFLKDFLDYLFPSDTIIAGKVPTDETDEEEMKRSYDEMRFSDREIDHRLFAQDLLTRINTLIKDFDTVLDDKDYRKLLGTEPGKELPYQVK